VGIRPVIVVLTWDRRRVDDPTFPGNLPRLISQEDRVFDLVTIGITMDRRQIRRSNMFGRFAAPGQPVGGNLPYAHSAAHFARRRLVNAPRPCLSGIL
jgi:hypothetical protein